MVTRSAGILIPLFSLRSDDDLGRGEILQMKRMIDFALRMGHRGIQLLPLDETAPGEASPYSALSVFAIDPLYISADELPGVGRLAMRRARRSVGAAKRVVPRSRYVAVKSDLLEGAFRAFSARAKPRENRALDDFLRENSYWLDDYALFRALKEKFAFRSWEEWPGDIARREPGALTSARRELAQTVRKYAYLQLVAHRQWKEVREYAAERGAWIGGDLAFSPARDSDLVWAHQENFDLTRTVGTPPDAFSEKGQRWGLPMPNWSAMRADGFEVWRSRVRHARGLYDLMRIDHVVGLYRTFSFGADPEQPGKFTPETEEEQRAQGEELIRAIREEAPGAMLVAEDLGTIPPWVRQSLAALGVPGYKVVIWERENWRTPEERFIDPRKYDELSLVTTGTHDTDALTVWWREQPVEERIRFIESLNLKARVRARQPLCGAALDAVLEALYAAPSIISVLPIQDLFGWSARINHPGTISNSNWSYRLPLTLERIEESRAMRARERRLVEIARQSGRFG